MLTHPLEYPMKSEWLYTFLLLTELRSTDRVAIKRGISGRAVLQHLNQLESSLGTALFLSHTAEKFQLSPAGEAILPYAHSVVRQLMALSDSCPPQAPIVIAFSSLIGARIVAQARHLAPFLQQHKLITCLCSPQYLAPYLDLFLADVTIGLSPLPSSADSPLMTQPIASLPNRILGVPQPATRWQEVKFLGLRSEPGDYEVPDDWDQQHFPRTITRYVSPNLYSDACCQGLGAAFVPAYHLQTAIHSGQVVELAPTPFASEVSYYLSWHRDNPIHQACPELLAAMQEVMA